jgi:hypothetical protein
VTNRSVYYFAAQLRDGMFRDQLDELGFDGNAGDVISIVADERPVPLAGRPAGRMLLAQEDEAQETGWRMWWAT